VIEKDKKKPRIILLLTRIASFHVYVLERYDMCMVRSDAQRWKSLKVVLQGHFSGYPSHKTYTCQTNFLVDVGSETENDPDWIREALFLLFFFFNKTFNQ